MAPLSKKIYGCGWLDPLSLLLLGLVMSVCLLNSMSAASQFDVVKFPFTFVRVKSVGSTNVEIPDSFKDHGR